MEKSKSIKQIDFNVYQIGKAFYDTAIQINSPYFQPKIVNLAFSTELLLKAISHKYIVSEGWPEKEFSTISSNRVFDHKHDLLKMFRKLDLADQNQISNLYIELFNGNKNSFIEVLSSTKDLFIKTRYTWEISEKSNYKEHYSGKGGLEKICQTLCKFIEIQLGI